MPSIFNTLSIGYSGLVAAQVGVDTTSHNITNAQSDGYTRQRVLTTATTPMYSAQGNVGNGTQILEISRIFDSFVFDRYTQVSGDKEYSDFTKTTLEELSTYFPEIEDVGIKADLKEYYKMWQSFADNPDNDSIKLALAKQTEILTANIRTTQGRIVDLQASINSQLLANVQEVNTLAEELAGVNASIGVAESVDGYMANDLRDRRNAIERDLAKLIGADSIVGQIESYTKIDSNSNEGIGSYTLNVNGFNIVDGFSYHPIHISNTQNSNGFYSLSYERQDGVLIPMEESISSGKIGAILALRGGKIETGSMGVPEDGILQKVIDQMDAFASTLIESTNNLYATSVTTKMESIPLDMQESDPVLNYSRSVKEGSFDIVVYDIDGEVAARRTINIDRLTRMGGIADSNSIEGQIKSQKDDNDDLNANNDIDDFINYNFVTFIDAKSGIELSMDAQYNAKGYTFAIVDNLKDGGYGSGTNFAGSFGLNRFFDGDSAKNIDLNFSLKENPAKVVAGSTRVSGDNTIALSVVQQQFEKYGFNIGRAEYNTTIYGMFDVVATEVGISTNEAILLNDALTAKFNATELEYSTISKVSIDEELTNLIKYQTSYGAASKIITTIDQMMQTLLGLKQ